MMTLVLRFAAAVTVAYAAAALAATQSVLGDVVALGLPVDWSTRLTASLHDLAGMATSFLPLIAIALAIAFSVAGLLSRWFRTAAPILFVVAGAAALLVLHVALKLAFDITPVAQARTAAGLAVQTLAGALGGLCFASLRRSRVGV